MIQEKECPVLVNGPAGVDFIDVSFTEGARDPFSRNRENDRSRIVCYFLILCGIMEIRETFSSGRGLCFKLFQSTIFAWPTATLACTLFLS